MIQIRVLHSRVVIESLRAVMYAADHTNNAPLYVTARTVLARVKQVKYLDDVDVTLSDEAAERLRWAGIHEDIYNALDAALGQKEASAAERRPKRRDRRTVRESRNFSFPG